MELPPELRAALERLLEGVRASELSKIAAAQSETYRRRADHGLADLLVSSEPQALAYAAWRLPATFIATSAVLQEVARLATPLAPRSHLDLGAGPGSAALAAGGIFASIDRVIAIEGSAAFRGLGERLFDELGAAPGTRPSWRGADLARPAEIDAVIGDDRFDLVTLCYVTGEIDDGPRTELVDAAWAHTAGVLVIVEPGTTAGHHRLLDARTRLLDTGAHVLGPCPHELACPLAPPDWCHFAARVPRSRLHRQVKGAELGWEDEKFAWLALTRADAGRAAGRVLRQPRVGKAAVEIDVCSAEGRADAYSVSRRAKAAWRRAKKLRWGDAVPDDLDARRVSD